MRRKHSTVGSHEAHTIRVAWWSAFFATVAVVAILGLARSAQALTVPAGDGAVSVAERTAPPDEEFEDEAEASEEDEFEAEYCDEDEECGDDEGRAEAPPVCLISTANPTVTSSHDKVRLAVHYTTSSPTAVAVEYGLHGGKGSLFLGSDRERLGASGTLHLSKHLTDAQMAKVMAATSFTVRLRVAAAPSYCSSFFDHQLKVKRATPSGLSWSQSE
jgi:hypothetical protein